LFVYAANFTLAMPNHGGRTHKCNICGYHTSQGGGLGYCSKHMELCPENNPNGLHPETPVYIYKKDHSGSYAQQCGACNARRKQAASEEREKREAQEKKAKKAADKVALKQDPGKERTKPRHDKSEKKKDKKDKKDKNDKKEE